MYQTKIKSIKKVGKIETYDLHTPNYHNFLLENGILSHNSGKSWAMLSIAHKLDNDFSVDQVAFSFKDVMKILNSEWFKKKKIRVILFDEAQTDINNRAWQSLTNKLFLYLTSTFRHQNVIFLMTSPYGDFIDSASMKLIHCQFDCKGHSRKTNLSTIRPLLQQYNSKLKKTYYHSLMVSSPRGVYKMTQWKVPKPPQHLIDPYEEKKTSFTSALNQDILAQLEGADKKTKEKIEKDRERRELTDKQKIALTLKKVYETLKKASEQSGQTISSLQQSLQYAKKKGYTPDMWVIPKELSYLAEI